MLSRYKTTKLLFPFANIRIIFYTFGINDNYMLKLCANYSFCSSIFTMAVTAKVTRQSAMTMRKNVG